MMKLFRARYGVSNTFFMGGRPQRYSDLAITTVLVIKRVLFRLTLRAAQGFIDSILH